MHFQCRSFIGQSSDSSWSQFWENEPDDQSVFQQRGHLFGLISLQSTTAPVVLAEAGHQFIDAINTNYFSSPFVSINSNLIDSLNNLSITEDIRLVVVIFVIHQNRLTVAVKGSASAYILRQPNIANILDNYSSEVKTIAGPIKSNDFVFVATSDFIKQIPWEEIKKSLSDTRLQSIEENLMSQLYNSSSQASSAAILVKVEEYQEQEYDPTPPVAEIPAPTPIVPTPYLSSRRHSGWSELVKKLLPRRTPITVNPIELQTHVRRKKTNIIIAAVLLICLFSSVVFGYKKKKDNDTKLLVNQLKTQLESKINDASAVKSLNIDSAKDLTNQSQDILNQIKAINPSGFDYEDYQKKIDNLLSVTGVTDTSSQSSFYSLNLINDHPSYSAMVISQDILYLLDTANNQIDKLNLTKKSYDKVIQHLNLSRTKNIFFDQTKLYSFDDRSLYLTQSDEVTSKFDFSKISASAQIIGAQSWNGAVYLLDSSVGTIWKLTPNSTGFTHQNWLKDGEKLKSTDGSMAINGEVWILATDGTVTPYLRGVKQKFPKPSDLTTSTATGLVTTPDGNLLAFYDDTNNIYVYTKEGKSHARFNLGQIKIKSLQMKLDNTILFALGEDQKIYSFSL